MLAPRSLAAVITLLTAKYPDPEPIRAGCRLIMSRQLRDGSWAQESIEGGASRPLPFSFASSLPLEPHPDLRSRTQSSTRMPPSRTRTSSLRGRSTRSGRRRGSCRARVGESRSLRALCHVERAARSSETTHGRSMGGRVSALGNVQLLWTALEREDKERGASAAQLAGPCRRVSLRGCVRVGGIHEAR